jgi:glycosyltransferase involved in cell wall biosynthesis
MMTDTDQLNTKPAGQPVGKTIWIVNQYAYTPNDSASTRHYAYARALKARGHDVYIVSSTYYHKGRRQRHQVRGQPFTQSMEGEVPFVWINVPAYKSNAMRLLNMLFFAFRLRFGRYKKQLPRPDTLFATSPSPLSAYAGLGLARAFKARFVLEIVDIWPDTLVEVSGVNPANPVIVFFRWVEGQLYKKADAILTHLARADQHFVARGAKPEKCFFLPSPAVFDQNKLEIDGGPSANAPFHFIHAGSLSGSYAPVQLLDALDIMQDRYGITDMDIRFTFLGEGPLGPAMKARVLENGQSEIVKFLDPVPKSQIIDTLKTANGFLLLAANMDLHRFGISFNKIFDYMLAGRPVVGACNDMATPINKADSGVFVPPESPDKLADALYNMMQLPQKDRQEMSRRGYAYVTQYHKLEKWAQAAEKII